MIPGDRLVCVFVEPQHEGFQFKDWLLHVTIVPWFRLDMDSSNIVNELEAGLQEIKPFTVAMGRENIRFGHQRGKMATLVQLPSPLAEIEQHVRGYLRSRKAWLVDETTKHLREFKPHITNQKIGSMHEGDMFTCDRLYLIEQKGGFKEVVGEVNLG
jgi:2'-5' RNA ligase